MENLELEDGEFDVQKTILRTRSPKNITYYIEYDKLTGGVLTISPEVIQTDSPRTLVLEQPANEIITNVFGSKVPMASLRVVYDQKTKTKLLTKQSDLVYNEFAYSHPDSELKQFVHLNVDVVSKRIRVKLRSDQFKEQITNELLNETEIAQYPDYLDVYCYNTYDSSILYDKLSIRLRDLFMGKDIFFNCSWLPNTKSDFANYNFVYYGKGLKITVSCNDIYETQRRQVHKPLIVYKQRRKTIMLQSLMSNHEFYYINNAITFYCMKESDPDILLDTITVTSDQLNDFNMIKMSVSFTEPVKIISNYSHIHMEHTDENSYYQF
jgi:hypothetical protein